MKKLISAMLAGAMTVSASGVVFADGGMEEILVSVKNKVNVPEELSEFETNYATDENGVTSYSFMWRDTDYENSIDVETDAYGNITNYRKNCDSWYTDEDEIKIDKNFDIGKLEGVADELLAQLVPELVKYDSDKLVRTPYEGDYTLLPNSGYNIHYIRKYHDVEVKDNGAYVHVRKTKDGYIADSAEISWEYSKEYLPVGDDYKPMDTESAEKALNEAAPFKLEYRKTYDDKYVLEYVRDGNIYIDAASGKEIKEAEKDPIIYRNGQKEASAADGGMGGGSGLTPKEVKELTDMAALKTPEELFRSVIAKPEFGIDKNIDLSKLGSNTYKAGDEYFTSVYIDESEKDGEYSSISAYFNAKTGEMQSYYHYSSDSSQEDREDAKPAYDFLKKYYGDKLSECDTSEVKSVYTRLVNNIPYTNNTISASWNSRKNRIESVNIDWDKDISKMPKPENIISADDAAAAAYKAYPAKLLYIISTDSDDMYTLCYTQNIYIIRIDAFGGKIADETDTAIKYYDDINGHWIKNIADTLCDYGIRLDGTSLKPDEKITQGDFLKLVYSGVFGYYRPDEYIPVYKTMINRRIISKEEENSAEPVERETAICYLLRAMGIKEVAEIDGIYICNFDDSDQISKDKYGYCAIAKGLGIVKGYDNKLNPTENITRAEALVMVYNYLTR